MREHQDTGSEVLTVSIRATPSFQAVSQAFRPEALMLANPFTLWMKMATLAWQPWLQLAGCRPPGPAGTAEARRFRPLRLAALDVIIR